MASNIEQFASNFNFGTLSKATELKKRIWFTLAALVVYRIGTYIPVPGIDPMILDDIFQQNAGGILSMFDMFAGGALSRMTIFALNIMPYISASIIMQLVTAMSPQMEALKKEGEQGRTKINQYTRYLTVILATIQGYGLAVGLESMQGSVGSAVIDPGFFFRITTMITIVGGTMFLMWLGEQITSRGVGNGISLIITAGIVAELPSAFASTFELGRTGALSTAMLLLVLFLVIAVITFIVYMERAQRRLIVQYPKRQVGASRMTGGQTSHLPLKLNTSGVIPPIFASSLLLLPLTLVGFAGAGADPDGILASVSQFLQHGSIAYMVLFGGLIAFFAFFYTAIVFNPKETADNLKQQGGFIPGIRPGTHTADYLDHVLTRITVLGAAYLVFICLLPEFLMAKYQLPFYFGGTSLLIVVTVTMDTVAQIQSHLIAHQYEGLIKKSRLRSRR